MSDDEDRDVAGGEEDFDLMVWARKSGLSRRTTGHLASEECTSKRVLRLLTATDIMSFPLPLGQRRLLQEAVTQLCDDPGDTGLLDQVIAAQLSTGEQGVAAVTDARLELPTATTPLAGTPPAGPTALDPGMQTSVPLDQLLRPLAAAMQADHGPAHQATAGVTLMPTGVAVGQPSASTYLNQHSAPGKPLHIVDYLSSNSQIYEEEIPIAGTAGDSRVVIKTGPRRPKVEAVTPSQWFAANCRMIDEMMVDAQCTPIHLRSYIAYVAKTCELSDRYVWGSVMLYDEEYRTQQARQQFPWGTDMPHFHTVFLREKHNTSHVGEHHSTVKKGGFNRGHERGRYRPPSQQDTKEPCRLYNVERCNFPNCRYPHICNVQGCGQSHPQTQHTKN